MLGAIIIFFYLLKLKRKRRVVPSVFLWQRAMEEIEANAPFRKLRRNLLLLLQLLALVALVLALARPLVSTRALAAGSSIIVIDSTASMGARDEGGNTRLSRAKELAREMIESLGGSDRAAVIESSSRVTVRSVLTSDRAALRSAINDIQETDAAGNLADALLLAEQLAKAERDAGIVVISDGGGQGIFSALASSSSRGVDKLSAAHAASLRLVRVGNRADNVGIVTLNSRPNPATGQQELFASVANFSDQAKEANLELRIEGNLVDARQFTLAAHDRAALVFEALPQRGGLGEVQLAADDDLAADNLAYAVLPDSRRLRVAVASDNPFLLQALAVNSAIDARKLTTTAAPLDDFDCVITDGPVASEILTGEKPLLAINPQDATGYWQASGQVENPAVTSLDHAHPVNRYLSYADLHIESLTRRQTGTWLKPVAQSGNEALIVAGEQNRRRVVMVSFDLAKSDLPLKIEFPILLANSIAWLAGREAVTDERAVRAGQPVIIRAQAAETSVTDPHGDAQSVALRDGAATFAETMRAGSYQVQTGSSFAVSLLSESESNTMPKDSIQTRAGEISGQQETFSAEREAWRWLLLLGLAVLAFEWYAYHRRIA